jgi:hypothetical protein
MEQNAWFDKSIPETDFIGRLRSLYLYLSM